MEQKLTGYQWGANGLFIGTYEFVSVGEFVHLPPNTTLIAPLDSVKGKTSMWNGEGWVSVDCPKHAEKIAEETRKAEFEEAAAKARADVEAQLKETLAGHEETKRLIAEEERRHKEYLEACKAYYAEALAKQSAQNGA